jgi:DNA primase
MAWSRAFTDELRAQADIRAIVSDYVTLKKKGQNFFGRCPFHQEKTGSFTVNPQRQIFKCFGCGKGGDVFTFLMEIERCTFPEAVKTVADKTGVTLPREANEAETEERDRKERTFCS